MPGFDLDFPSSLGRGRDVAFDAARVRMELDGLADRGGSRVKPTSDYLRLS